MQSVIFVNGLLLDIFSDAFSEEIFRKLILGLSCKASPNESLSVVALYVKIISENLWNINLMRHKRLRLLAEIISSKNIKSFCFLFVHMAIKNHSVLLQ